MERRCKYASKPCSNQRSLKDNGDYHILCDFHRDKANQAQRRWYLRKTPAGKDTKRTTDRKVAMDAKPLRRQRKVTSQANAEASGPLRKRGRVTFRDNTLRAEVISAPHFLNPFDFLPRASFVAAHDPCAVIQTFEPLPLPWINVAFQQVDLESKRPFPAPLDLPNDIALVSLFS